VKLQNIFSNIYFWTSEKLTVETQKKIQDRYRITLADLTYVITFDEVMKNILTTQNIHTEQFKSYKSLRQEKALKTIDRLQSTQKTCHHAFSYIGDISSTIRDAVQLLSRNKFHETFQAINDHFINLWIFDIARFEQDVQHHIKNLRGAIQRCWMMMELLDRALIHSPCPSSQYHRQIQLHQHMQTHQLY
jgi:hypothetical protein